MAIATGRIRFKRRLGGGASQQQQQVFLGEYSREVVVGLSVAGGGGGGNDDDYVVVVGGGGDEGVVEEKEEKREKNGFGMMRYFDGSVHLGSFSLPSGEREGVGVTQQAESGDIIQAGFWNGLKDGVCLCTFSRSGDRFIGECKAGVRIGLGQYTWASDGSSHEGEYENGMANGLGVLFQSLKGDMFMGDFKNDLPEGFGVCYYSSGDVYEGQWKRGYRHGFGRLTESEGNSPREGMWKKGLLLLESEAARYLERGTDQQGQLHDSVERACKRMEDASALVKEPRFRQVLALADSIRAECSQILVRVKRIQSAIHEKLGLGAPDEELIKIKPVLAKKEATTEASPHPLPIKSRLVEESSVLQSSPSFFLSPIKYGSDQEEERQEGKDQNLQISEPREEEEKKEKLIETRLILSGQFEPETKRSPEIMVGRSPIRGEGGLIVLGGNLNHSKEQARVEENQSSNSSLLRTGAVPPLPPPPKLFSLSSAMLNISDTLPQPISRNELENGKDDDESAENLCTDYFEEDEPQISIRVPLQRQRDADSSSKKTKIIEVKGSTSFQGKEEVRFSSPSLNKATDPEIIPQTEALGNNNAYYTAPDTSGFLNLKTAAENHLRYNFKELTRADSDDTLLLSSGIKYSDGVDPAFKKLDLSEENPPVVLFKRAPRSSPMVVMSGAQMESGRQTTTATNTRNHDRVVRELKFDEVTESENMELNILNESSILNQSVPFTSLFKVDSGRINKKEALENAKFSELAFENSETSQDYDPLEDDLVKVKADSFDVVSPRRPIPLQLISREKRTTPRMSETTFDKASRNGQRGTSSSGVSQSVPKGNVSSMESSSQWESLQPSLDVLEPTRRTTERFLPVPGPWETLTQAPEVDQKEEEEDSPPPPPPSEPDWEPLDAVLEQNAHSQTDDNINTLPFPLQQGVALVQEKGSWVSLNMEQNSLQFAKKDQNSYLVGDDKEWENLRPAIDLKNTMNMSGKGRQRQEPFQDWQDLQPPPKSNQIPPKNLNVELNYNSGNFETKDDDEEASSPPPPPPSFPPPVLCFSEFASDAPLDPVNRGFGNLQEQQRLKIKRYTMTEDRRTSFSPLKLKETSLPTPPPPPPSSQRKGPSLSFLEREQKQQDQDMPPPPPPPPPLLPPPYSPEAPKRPPYPPTNEPQGPKRPPYPPTNEPQVPKRPPYPPKNEPRGPKQQSTIPGTKPTRTFPS